MANNKNIQRIVELCCANGKTAQQELKNLATDKGLTSKFEEVFAELKQYFTAYYQFLASIDSNPSAALGANVAYVQQQGTMSQKMWAGLEYEKLKKLKSKGGASKKRHWKRFEASFVYRWTTIFGIEVLELDFFKLPLPHQISKLPNLKKVHVSMEGKADFWESLEFLTQIQVLAIRQSSLKQVPFSLAPLRRLKKLDLSLNVLTNLPPSFDKLQHLETLDLSNNKLKSLPEELTQLSSLQTLNLSRNKLQELPQNLDNLKRLTLLDLYDNQLQALPESLGDLNSLQNLNLMANELSDLPETLGNLSRLLELDLSFNRLRAVPTTLSKLTQLKTLNLTRNRPPKSSFLGNLWRKVSKTDQLYKQQLPPEILALENTGTTIKI